MEVINLPAVIFSLLLLLSPSAAPGQSDFSGDSALATLRTLSVDIGPRPMGSPAERRAMQYAVDRFREYGCQEAYIMPMMVAEAVNTNSGIAIGVLKGKTDRIIIIGGHIDSSGPEIPGANDDGSGVACVIELARVLSKQHHESTIMFCGWGGEEQGLQGATYFVEHFDRIDSVVLMLQIDMADGSSTLGISPDYRELSAPEWLTRAAYEVFYDELQLSGLVYPAASAALNSASGGATGSDHNAFLAKGIPAIDFTSDVDYPIHTPQDHLENFDPSGLKRTGDLVLKLAQRFDAGVPSRTLERYMLVQVGTTPVFLSYSMLWTVLCLALVLAVAAIAVLKRRRVSVEGTGRVRWSAIKLVLVTFIVQTFVWMSETFVGVVAGQRFPWVNNFPGFALLGVLSGLIGLWLALRLIRRLQLTTDAFAFCWRSLALLLLLTLLMALRSPELGIFPGISLLLMSIAFLVRSPGLRITFWVLSCLLMLRLVFFEELGLIQRLLTQNRIHATGGLIAYEAGFVVVFAIVSLPFMFGFVGLYRASGIDLLRLKKFRAVGGVLVVTGLAICLSIYLMLQPAYDARWYNNLSVEQRYVLGSDSSQIELKGSEYLKGTTLREGKSENTLQDQANYHEFKPTHPARVHWTSVERSVDSVGSAMDTVMVKRSVRLHSLFRPFLVAISYRSNLPFTIQSSWSHGGSLRLGKETDSLKVFSWYCFPDTNLVVPVTFGLSQGQDIVEKIEVTYDSLAYDLRLEREFTNVHYRTIVVDVDTFSSSASGAVVSGGGE